MKFTTTTKTVIATCCALPRSDDVLICSTHAFATTKARKISPKFKERLKSRLA